MVTQGDRQDFMFPPNDNSSTTNLRYSLLAEKLLMAAELKHKPTSFKADLSVVGILLQLAVALAVMVVALIIDFVKLVRSQMD